MLGLTGLIDALMAARLTPRLDLLGLKSETTVGAPGAAVAVPKTANDVRLPSRAALDRLVPSGASGGDVAAPAGGGAPSSIDTRLSVAARVIGAVLADLQAEPGPVRGEAPLLLPVARQGVNAAALSGTLAQTVSDSGLFYESHLAEFAAGTRTLAQMAREPQARWASPVMVATTLAPTGQGVVTAATALTVADGATQPAPNAAAPADAPESEITQPERVVARSETVTAPAPDAARVQAAYGVSDAEPEMPAPRIAEQARAAVDVASTPAPRGAEVIHPQAVTVVHQQLDLLASAAFRWSGHAWPEVPMAWAIEEEQAKPGAREGEPSDEEGARRWSTTVSLVLPRLGEVDLRLSLCGPTVQAHLHAREDSTVARLRGDAGRLAQRFEAVGLQLQQLQVTAKEAG
ncbi:flagellar hook-length control protein FliK [Variovorax paradoxus]|uniref:Flagellar hook-length control protein FliK n=1 Tax=Variovorax paradoxus TaxID=34073 RepID=A0A5Q0ME80_VARPD|nr:flagellar hook-length control protein FliK [Variovorax paradoxus]QFZ87839.1 flagellar hook-length control protein FliK [Variovorax paradoxus]